MNQILAVLGVLILGDKTSVGQPVQADLRVLSFNVFGKNDAFCEMRAYAFGHIVANAAPAYDLVGLTEYYSAPDLDLLSCDAQPLLDAIRCTGRYATSANSRRFYPRVGGAVDGGQGIFTIGSICEFQSHAWSIQINPRQGVILARVQLPNSTVTVDAYVVHLYASGADNCDLCCRWLQLQELRAFIAQHSARSGNPVIVMGDFNIAGPPSCCSTQGYEYIKSALGNPADLWYDEHPCGQSNCGNASIACHLPRAWLCDRLECEDNPSPNVIRCEADPDVCGAVVCVNQQPQPDCPANSPTWRGWAGYTSDRCLNELADAYERIDYIFLVNDPALSSSAWVLEPVDAMVTDFVAAGVWSTLHCARYCPFNCAACGIVQVGAPFLFHVSDHLGVEATVRIRGDPAVWVDRTTTAPQLGTSCAPFATVTAGTIFAPQGHRVLIRSGVYDESPTISRRLRLEALAGLVRIGG